MILVEHRPELQVYQGCLLELLDDLLLFPLHLELGDQVQKLPLWSFAHLVVDFLLQGHVLVVLVEGEVLVLYEQQVLERGFLLLNLEQKSSILQLELRVDGS